MATDTEQRLEKLMERFDRAMLVTRSKAGELRARPMAIVERSGEGQLVFATHGGGEKVDEILADDHVAVTMQSESVFLSLSGHCHVSKETGKADADWTPTLRAWFPQGVDDPGLVLLEVRPTQAEYWDLSGMRRLRFLIEAGRAVLQKETEEERVRGEHAKVTFA